MACTILSMPLAPHELSLPQEFLPLLPQDIYHSQQPNLSNPQTTTHQPKSSSLSSKLSFLSLPPELRNQIYTLTLLSATPITLPYAYQNQSFREPALLATCQVIRAEATPIFYGGNVFEAPSPAAAYSWLAKLEKGKVALLREFRPVDLCLPVLRTAAVAEDVVERQDGEDSSRNDDTIEDTPRPRSSPQQSPTSTQEGNVSQPTTRSASPPPISPSPSAAFPRNITSTQAEIHHRWFSAQRTNINKLVSFCGKGALAPEAIRVPVRRSWDGEKVWVGIVDIEGFVVVREKAQTQQRVGKWRLEWRDEDGTLVE
jgi:hypothetical protein